MKLGVFMLWTEMLDRGPTSALRPTMLAEPVRQTMPTSALPPSTLPETLPPRQALPPVAPPVSPAQTMPASRRGAARREAAAPTPADASVGGARKAAPLKPRAKSKKRRIVDEITAS